MFKLHIATGNAEFENRELSAIEDVLSRVQDTIRVLGPCQAETDGPWPIMDENGHRIGEWEFASEEEEEETKTRDEIYAMGHERGTRIASWADVPTFGEKIDSLESADLWCAGRSDVVTRDNCQELMEQRTYRAEENNRQFSPFEFTAKELNDMEENADFEVWEAYDEGITDGIQEHIAERVPLNFILSPMAGASGTSAIVFPNGKSAEFIECPGIVREAFPEFTTNEVGTSAKTWEEWTFRDSKGRMWTLYDYDDCPRPQADVPYGWHIGTVDDAKCDVDQFVAFLRDSCHTRIINCDKCEMIGINGIACHETGCPNA